MIRRLVMSILLAVTLSGSIVGGVAMRAVADDAFGRLLQLALGSALETDRLQTEHWVRGTPENPVRTPNGLGVFEVNPILAGRPGEKDGYFDVLTRAAQAVPQMTDSPWAKAAMALWAAGQMKLVADNNARSARLGLPQYWMLSHRWRF